MLDINKDTFQSEVLDAEGLVVVDYWRESCPDCVALIPELEDFVKRNSGRAKFCKVDVSTNKDLARKQGLASIPSIIFYRNGKKEHVFTGDFVEKIRMEGVQNKLDELLAV
ncbi:MAG: thioredoxin family protein [Defluviitaleaceae bacterium]|nr:thioredoxin family protein [Defluviitaleaceae bacterium]